MPVIGRAWLREALSLRIPPVRTPASVQPVTRVGPGGGDSLAVPASVAPGSDDPLDHVLFALKHEGTDLQVLSAAIRHIPAARMESEVRRRPTGSYVRKAAWLWEHFNETALGVSSPATNFVPLFDPKLYVAGPSREVSTRWRVFFDGFGSLDGCATVRRTPALERKLDVDVLGEAKQFAEQVGPRMLDRALAWAYLDETESSFEIERERPPADKREAFADLLRQAGSIGPLTEDLLVDLQSRVVTNASDQAHGWRQEQNWLRGGSRGAAGVTYVPPPPEAVPELMSGLMALSNATAAADPLVVAAIVSFGFVFIHPFMDGNGRLSRFLVHHQLGRSGQLPKGFVLPVSVAMKRHEARYREVLESFSKPVRALWSVTKIDDHDFDPRFRGDAGVYRYRDATEAVEFVVDMARESLERDLRDETVRLGAFDVVREAVDARFDIRASVLATLIHIALDADGTISDRKRARFASQVPAGAFEAIEEEVRQVLGSQLRPAP